jgi:hypothetical protein
VNVSIGGTLTPYAAPPVLKSWLMGTVRMETPVLYFYADREMDVDVKVDFPKGKITEWYPSAREVTDAGILWGKLKIMPGAKADFPREKADSHYYPARETDAAPLRVCLDGGLNEFENFLFYRGVGTFDQPVKARLEGDAVRLDYIPLPAKRAFANLGAHPVIVFENRGGKTGYLADQFMITSGLPPIKRLEIRRPSVSDKASSGAPERELEKILVGQGLYEKEARAMLARERATRKAP